MTGLAGEQRLRGVGVRDIGNGDAPRLRIEHARFTARPGKFGRERGERHGLRPGAGLGAEVFLELVGLAVEFF